MSFIFSLCALPSEKSAKVAIIKAQRALGAFIEDIS
jgi:hypothetical protein